MTFDVTTAEQASLGLETTAFPLYEGPTKAGCEFLVSQRKGLELKEIVVKFYENVSDIPAGMYGIVDSVYGFQFVGNPNIEWN